MEENNTVKRRAFLQTGAVAITAASLIGTAQAALKPKAADEIKVVCVMGANSPVAQETSIRSILGGRKNWRLIFVRASKFFTPELIKDADLLITARGAGRDPLSFSAEPLVDSVTQGDLFWTKEQVAAIVDNVTKRGMGFLALHETVECGNRDIENLLDLAHQESFEIQPIWTHDINKDHAITKGIKPFYFNIDLQYCPVIKSEKTVALFQTSAVHDKREALGGWCLENDNGRVVVLLPGHTEWTYRAPEYQEILWRSAHWAVKRDITPYPGPKNTI